MYEDPVEPCNFDPNSNPLPPPPPPPPPPQPSMEEELPNELLCGLGFNMEANWDNNILGIHGGTTSTTTTTSPYTPTPDLLNLFNSSSIAFTNPHFPSSFGYLEELPGGTYAPSGTTSTSVLYDYDPLFHFNVPPQPPLMFTAELPHGSYSLRNGRGRGVKGSPRCTDRDKRTQLNARYNALRKLVPNPTTKGDRASIVGDAIDYIKELLRTVDELKLLVERKRCRREGIKRRKTNETSDGGGTGGDDERGNMKLLGGTGGPHDQSYNNGSLRSSWLQRKSKDTEVDARIIDDEVTIKLVQKKKINVLLFVSKLLDELQLDVHHIAGSHIGNSYSFLFNTKMYEGCSLYASVIAQKLIEAMDRQYAAVPPTDRLSVIEA